LSKGEEHRDVGKKGRKKEKERAIEGRRTGCLPKGK
jgi:hypothetical protein